WDMAKYEIDHGIIPDASFDRAIENYNEDFKRSPQGGYAFFNRGLVYISRAEYKIRTGQDPTQDLTHATEDFQASVSRHSELTSTFLQIATIHFLSARYEFGRGNDPTAALAQARNEVNEYLDTDDSHADADLQH